MEKLKINMKTYGQLLRQGEQALKDAGIEYASADAWYLFEAACSMDRMTYLLEQNRECESKEKQKKYEHWIERRIRERIPMQYLIGSQEFMGLTFKVNEHVLIPRQDTEVLVETVLEQVKGKQSLLDVCTGSGCIAISLACLGDFSKCTALDISKEALKIAKENGKTLAPMVEFIDSDLFSEVEGTYDVIVSNPPYIATEECQTLMPEVREHEPMLALDGHKDGLYFYRKIVAEAANYLNPDGLLCFEIGYDQGESVPVLMREAGFCDIVVKKDLAGLDRVVYGRYQKREE